MCQTSVGFVPKPIRSIGFPWLQSSKGYHASFGPLCLQLYLLPLLFGCIMQRSGSTKSACPSSIQPSGGTGRRWKDGRKGEVSFLLVSGASPWRLSLLCGSSARRAYMLLLPWGAQVTPLLLLSLPCQWLLAAGAPPHLCLSSQLFHRLCFQ